MQAVALVLVALFAMSQGATLSTTSMVNTSALIGGTASFTCTLSGSQGLGETLSIYKIYGNNQNLVLSQDASVANTTKHSIAGTYTITINDVTFSDEGEYTCQLAGTNAATVTAYLTVGVVPTNAWLYFNDNSTTAPENVKTNLTCEADSSYPPATFRWKRGTVDVTATAKTPTITTDANGYGNGKSYLELTPTLADVGTVYTCDVDVPGKTSVFTKTITLALSGSSTIMASLGLLVAAVLATKF